MKQRVMKSLEGRKWKLLGHYKKEYPTDWIKTINECLDDESNLWEFRYDANGKLNRIRIITNYGSFKSEWNYYIVFED